MRAVFIILFSVLLVIFQLTILPLFSVYSIFPNLVLGFVLALAISRESQRHIIAYFLVPSLLFDFLSGSPFGATTLSLWFAFTSVSWVTITFLKQNNFAAIVAVVTSGVIFYEFVFRGIIKFFSFFHYALSINGFPFAQSLFFLLITVIYNVFATLLILGIFERFLNKKIHGRIRKF